MEWKTENVVGEKGRRVGSAGGGGGVAEGGWVSGVDRMSR